MSRCLNGSSVGSRKYWSFFFFHLSPLTRDATNKPSFRLKSLIPTPSAAPHFTFLFQNSVEGFEEVFSDGLFLSCRALLEDAEEQEVCS